MDAFIVRGGASLAGTVRVNGAKNSALKLVAAALLAEGRSVIHNVPDIVDMRAMADVVGYLGVAVDRGDPATFVLDVPDQLRLETPADLARQLRASIVLLGPLLARGGRARLAMPGGCNLGSRGIDIHVAGLAQLGAEVHYSPDAVEAVASRLRGADIELPFASVGATENLMLAAVTAQGTTRIVNAAREPEIVDLADFLASMGAQVHGAGSPQITIEGVDRLHPTSHQVVGDRIEAGTFAVGAVLTAGDVELTGVRADHLRLSLDKLEAVGAEVTDTADGFRVRGTGMLRATDVVTLPYPGFATDLQAQFLVLLSQAKGTSMVTENVYDGRFSVIDQLTRLGAEIEVEGHHAVVRGPCRLTGTAVRATDLRGGAGLVLAGLVADGDTVVTDAQHVDRGYADFASRLRALGADVERGHPDTGIRARNVQLGVA